MPQKSAQEFKFVITHGAEKPRRVTLSKSSLSVGRGPDSDIVLDGDGVSRCHTLLVYDGLRWIVEDRSVNGTFIDGERVRSHHVWEPDSQIQIGNFLIKRITERLVLKALDPETGDDPLDEPTERFIVVLDEEPLSGPISIAPCDASALAGVPLQTQEVSHTLVAKTTALSTTRAPLDEVFSTPTDHVAPQSSQPLNLAQAYRLLAERSGAISWGSPPQAVPEHLNRLQEEAANALIGFDGDAGRWSTLLAHEVCGDDPLTTLLRDPDVTEILVCGDRSIELVRSGQREESAIRFSCDEALHAAYVRVTGRELSRASQWTHTHQGLTCYSVPRGLAQGGPLVLCRRQAQLDDNPLATLPEPTVRYLRRAQSRGASLLLVGGPLADLGHVQHALACDLPHTSTMTIVQRSTTWPPGRAIIVDGHSPPEDLWPCIHRLRRDWLLIEELSETDMSSLRSYTRHYGGGIIATRRHGPMETPHELALALQGLFDVIITVDDSTEAPLSITSIAELRTSGLIEIFAAERLGGLLATGSPSAL